MDTQATSVAPRFGREVPMKRRILIPLLGLCATLLALPMAAYAAPGITLQPEGADYALGSQAAPLEVGASCDEDETLSYQWYSSATDSSEGGEPIEGATGNAYVPATKAEGVTWYYCTVTATDERGETSCVVTDPVRVEVATYYDVWVAGTRVSSLNAADVLGDADEGASVTYAAETGTLELDGASIAVSGERYAVYAEQDLIISLKGASEAVLYGTTGIDEPEWGTGTDGAVPEATAAIACNGGSLTVRSAGANRGTLQAVNDADVVYYGLDGGSFMVGGIVATGGVSIEGATVSASAGYANGAYPGVMNCSYGIFAGAGVTVDDADVTARGDEATRSAGIYAPEGDIDLNGGDVAATGGQAATELEGYLAHSAGISADDGTVNIADGSVRACVDGISGGSDAYGIHGYRGVNITGGEVSARGTGANVDAVEPQAGIGIGSTGGDVVISGKTTSVDADGGFAKQAVIGIGAQSGNVLITDASVKAAARYAHEDEYFIAAGIYASQIMQPMSMGAGDGAGTGNIVLKGADVQVVGITDPVFFTGSLTAGPAEGMRYAVDALAEAVREDDATIYWNELAASAQGIEGSPFAEETSIDGDLVTGREYLHFHNVGTESEPEAPEDQNDPVVPEDPEKPAETTEPEAAAEEVSGATMPETGDLGAIAPLAAAACSALAIGAGAAIRRKRS